MLPADLREARRQNLERLREYTEAGVFPRNYLYSDQNRPCFIDRDNRICAAGYLVEHSAGRKVAEQINERVQSEFLWRMQLPELDRWIAGSGLSLIELCMIQPTYDPVFFIEIDPDSARAPVIVSITGDVIDFGFGCGIKYVEFDFGDGEIWTSAIFNASYVPVDIEHMYTCPGAYTITGSAVAVVVGAVAAHQTTWGHIKAQFAADL